MSTTGHMGFLVYRRKIRFWDVDAYGHVFNPRYLVYFDDVLCDAFDAAGVSFLAEENGGYEFVVAHLECDFVGAARMGQEITTSISIERFGNTSIVFSMESVDDATGETIVRGSEVYVVIDAETRRPTPVPDAIRDGFETLA